MKKVVILDFNIFMFRSIFAWERNRNVPPTYTTLSMIIACLKAVGLHPDDLVILALDSPKGSWRRDFDLAYKANRKEQREKHDIDWKSMFNLFKNFLYKLEASTPFVQIMIDFCEADDIISVSCRHFKNIPVIIISSDSDYEMLTQYPHVKILSPKTKKYKVVKNPDLILANKIKKETTDNLTSEILTEEDYIRREKIVNLLRLPDDIENKVLEQLENIKPNDKFDLNIMPFPFLRNRFMDIFCDIGEAQLEEVKEEKKKLLKKSKRKILKQKQLTI